MIDVELVDPGIDVLRVEIGSAPIGSKTEVIAAAERATSTHAFWLACDAPAALLWVLARFGHDRHVVLRVAQIALEASVDLLVNVEDALALARRVGNEAIADDVLETAARSLARHGEDEARTDASLTASGCVDAMLGAGQSWIDDATFVTLATAVARRGVNARSFVEDDTADAQRRMADAIRAACTLTVR